MKFVFDIDDTILYSDYDNGKYNLKGCNQELIDKINKLHFFGHQIILQTGRHWNDLMLTKNQLSYYNVKYHSLIMGKPVADYYVDDKGCTPEEFLKKLDTI
jgi:hypothetical protein